MRKKQFIIFVLGFISICLLLQIPLLNDNYISYILILPGLILGFIFGVIIHELGHLVCGMISGYKFTSFKVLFLKIYKTDKIKIKFEMGVLSIPGQCLMKPTNRKFFLYNLGGLIFTYLLSSILIILFYLNFNIYLSQILFGMFITNTMLGIMNSIYNKDGINDICNIVRCKTNKQYLEGFLYQLDIYSNISSKNKFRSIYNPSDDVGNIYSNITIYRFKYFRALSENNFEKMEYYYTLIKRSYNYIPLYFLKLSILLLILNHEFMYKKDLNLLRRSVKLNKRDQVLFKKMKDEYQVYLFFKNCILNKEENFLDFEKLIIPNPSDMIERLHNKLYEKLNRVYIAYVAQEFNIN